MDLKESDLLGDKPEEDWYYASKGRILLEDFRAVRAENWGQPLRVADIGAGIGLFDRILARECPGGVVSALLVDSGYQADEEEEVLGMPVRRARELPQVLDAQFLMLMDVLEHIEDDQGFLSLVVSRARRGAVFFLTVPAFQFLWSGHDDFLGHHRRYRLPELEAKCRAAGLEVEEGYYFFAGIFPLVVLFRWGKRLFSSGAGSDMRPTGPVMNSILRGLHRVEARFRRINRWFGLTAVVRARKAGSPK